MRCSPAWWPSAAGSGQRLTQPGLVEACDDPHISKFPHFHISQFPNSMSPLDGLLVLDFSRVLAGPYCTMQLADLGARVIKIEQPGRGDDTRAWGPPFVGRESAYFLSVNRNKESLALDLKSKEAHPILDALLSRADVVVENFRPGTMERLGLGYAEVAAHHPRIVYCSISGFGQTGPRRAEAGYDAMMAADGDFGLAVGNDSQFRRLAEVLGRPALASDARFTTNADRVANHEALRRELLPLFGARTREDIVQALTAAGVPSGAVRSVTEALADPQLAAREMIVPLDHLTAGPIRVLGTPLKLSDTPARVRTPPPVLGQHTVSVLRDDLGLSESEILALQRDGAVA